MVPEPVLQKTRPGAVKHHPKAEKRILKAGIHRKIDGAIISWRCHILKVAMQIRPFPVTLPSTLSAAWRVSWFLTALARALRVPTKRRFSSPGSARYRGSRSFDRMHAVLTGYITARPILMPMDSAVRIN